MDISRDKVPTLATLKSLVERLASLKLNQLQLYMEHTFAYPGHELVWRDASPLRAEEVREFDAYCALRHVELVPNQNSFGHMHRWLTHSPYRALAECPEGFEHPWNWSAPTASGPGAAPTTQSDVWTPSCIEARSVGFWRLTSCPSSTAWIAPS